MKHHHFSCFALILFGAMACSAVSAGNTITRKVAQAAPVGSFAHNRHAAVSTATISTQTGTPAAATASRVKSNYEDPDTIASSNAFGFLVGPDGKDWMFTQTFEKSGYYYTSTEIAIYNGEYEKVGTISFSLDELGINNSTMCNQIEPYGVITSKFFDNSASTYEVLVFVHTAGTADDGYTGTSKVYVYNTNNELVNTLDGSNAAMLDVTGSANDMRLMVIDSGTDDDGNSVYTVDVLQPASYYNSYTPTSVHTFSVPADNTIAAMGQYCNAYVIDGKAYYVLSYYEQPYYTGEWTEDYEQVRTEDNNYLVKVYDEDFSEVASISIPVFEEEPDEAYRCFGFGYLSDDDLSKGKFTGDDEFNFIISIDDYYYSDDVDKFSFLVYDSNGDKINTIADNVDSESSAYMKLADINGQEEQWMFGRTVDDVTTLDMINVPSCTQVASLPSTIDGYTISTYLNRYPTDDGGYKYAIGLNTYLQDSDGNIYANVAWVDSEANLERIVSFNITENGVGFIPNINETTLDPYFFNTDVHHEYVYFSYEYDEETTKNLPHLYVADHEGGVLAEYTYGGEWSTGYTMSASFPNYDSDNPAMLVAYYNYDTTSWEITLFDLPMEKFMEGGDGTEDDPYLVSTLGDLKQIASDPTACYKQVNSIFMSGYGEEWTPIEEFTGTYDGDGYNLSGMTIDTDEPYVGLFGTLNSGATVKNIIFDTPTISIHSGNYYVGTVAGYTYGCEIDNVHVYDASITSDTDASVSGAGGIVGFLSGSASVSDCSFNDGEINTPALETVGGIVGDMRTSSTVSTCAVSGTITAAVTVGGIVGNAGSNAGAISDCHVNAAITGQNTIGGIAGASKRGGISRCYVEGTIEATEEDWWGDGFLTGGIVGNLSSDFTSSTTAVVEDCLVALESITLAEAEAEDLTAARIAGYTTRNNADYVESGLTENGLSSNYALSTMTVGGSVVTESDATSADGESIDEEDITTDFFTSSLAFSFGTDKSAPWKESDDSLPLLYFEGDNLTDAIKAIPSAGGSSVALSDGVISSADAVRIDIYSTSGVKVAGAKAGSISTGSLTSGVYVVVVTGANGKTVSKKMVIR